jgi:O-antigen/teichoic acid export membrane protein
VPSEEFPKSVPVRNLIKDVLSISSGDILGKAFAFATLVYVVNKLSPEYFGYWTYAAVIVGFFYPVVEFGLNPIATRIVAKDPNKLAYHIEHIVSFRLIISGIAFVAIVLLSALLTPLAIVRALIIVSGLVLIVHSFSLLWAYQALGENLWFTLEKIIQNGLFMIAVMLLVRSDSDLILLPTLFFVAVGVGYFAVVWGFLRGRMEHSAKLDLRKFKKEYLRPSVTILLFSILQQVHVSIDPLIIGLLRPGTELGYYSAPARIILALAFIPNLIASAFYPFLAEASSQRENWRNIAESFFWIMMSAAICFASIGLLYSSDIVGLLFGLAYEQSEGTLQVLMIVFALSFLSSAAIRIALSIEQENKLLPRLIVTGIVHGGGSLILLESIGIVGAALGYLIGEMVLLVANRDIVRESLTGRSIALPLGRLFLAAFVSFGPIAFLVRDQHFVVGIVALVCSVLIYGAVVWRADIVRRDVLRRLIRH